MPLALAVPPGRPTLTNDELQAAHWIVPPAIPGFPGLDEIASQLWRQLGIAPPSVQRVTTLQTALPLVAADLAVALLPVDGLGVVWDPENVRTVPPDLPPLFGVMVQSAHISPSPTLEVFLEVIDTELEEGGTGQTVVVDPG